MRATILIAAILMTGCSSECAERGGTVEFSHNLVFYNQSLKTTQIYPQYRCVVPD